MPGAILATAATGSDTQVCPQRSHAGRTQFKSLADFLVGHIVAYTNDHGGTWTLWPRFDPGQRVVALAIIY